jgi:hypothetical protein
VQRPEPALIAVGSQGKGRLNSRMATAIVDPSAEKEGKEIDDGKPRGDDTVVRSRRSVPSARIVQRSSPLAKTIRPFSPGNVAAAGCAAITEIPMPRATVRSRTNRRMTNLPVQSAYTPTPRCRNHDHYSVERVRATIGDADQVAEVCRPGPA